MDVAACRVHKLVADVAVLTKTQVLMVRYKDTSRYDHQPGWFLPDDYLHPLEHPDAAAARILQEQIGLRGFTPRLDHIESFGNGAWHLIFHYAVEVDQPVAALKGANTADAQWFPLTALPHRDDLAHHGWARDVLGTILHRPFE